MGYPLGYMINNSNVTLWQSTMASWEIPDLNVHLYGKMRTQQEFSIED